VLCYTNVRDLSNGHFSIFSLLFFCLLLTVKYCYFSQLRLKPKKTQVIIVVKVVYYNVDKDNNIYVSYLNVDKK